ncbi:hypothetical protein CHS0354_039331 [Potamilus streckersoni]|uniref:VWFA domain-containing protein n=1 Tax=Potamilus streckersoni TaxID=2493646 RepID=A0AAE0T332_9BIVA|nr:hypothetical protein CHS0354_039331 [Potamilus streckersoni]
MVKRKASSASPYERPTKFIKQSTSSDLGDGLNLGRRAQTIPKAPLESSNFPPLKLTKKTRTDVTSSNGEESAFVAPNLRRASTLPIEDTELVSENNYKSPSKRRSRPDESLPFKRTKTSDGSKTSPSRKSSSFLLTTVEPLKSGSSVGETKLDETKWNFTPQNFGIRESPTKTSFKGKMSRSVSDAGPILLPSFTEFASKGKTSLSMSKSALLGPIEEEEITRALASLRSYTSASGKSFSETKSASLIKDLSSGNMLNEEPNSFIKHSSVERTLEGKEAMTSCSSHTTETDLNQPKPHNRLMEIVFSFDTTGSMSSCLDEVRNRIKDMVQRLRADIPGIRIAVICHGDYCDSDKYVVQWIDFGASLPELSNFVSRVERTHGGDAAECYELVLKRVREALSWTPGSQRSLILIGDDEPHSVGYVYGSHKFINQIDWREEVQLLKDMGLRIYGVQVDGSAYATYFYREMAEVTGGHHLKLQEFSSIFSFLMAICYKEGSPDLLPNFEAEVRAQNKKGIALDVEGLFLDLKYPRTHKSYDLVVTKSTKLAITTASKRIKSPPRKKAAEKTKAQKNTGSKTGKKKERRPKSKSTKVKLAAKSKMAKSKKGQKAKSRTRAEGTKRSKAKKINKIKKPALREKVSESKFKTGPLERLKWSSWHLGVVAKLPKKGTMWGKGKSMARNCAGKTSQRVPKCGPSDAWHTCKHYMGYRRVDLFKNDTRPKALYEIAVQMPKKPKKYVVYFRLSKGFASSGLWDTYLIHDKSVQAEMQKVLKKGCNIHVRRGVIPGHSDRSLILFSKVKDHLRKNYDYAWRKGVNGKKLHRKVEMNGVIISHGNI